jgi:hypothetical protein
MAAFTLLYFVRRPIPIPLFPKRCQNLMRLQCQARFNQLKHYYQKQQSNSIKNISIKMKRTGSGQTNHVKTLSWQIMVYTSTHAPPDPSTELLTTGQPTPAE